MAITDNFNRANANPLDGNWVTLSGAGALRIVSNAVQNASGTDTDSGAYRNDGTFPANQYAQVVLSSGTTPDAGPSVRNASGALTCYFATHFNTEFHIYKVEAGVFTQLGFFTQAWNVGETLKIVATGTGITCHINGGSALVSVTDSGIASGNPGIFIYEGSIVLDDFECTDFTPSSRTTKNTRTFPLGTEVGMGLRMNL